MFPNEALRNLWDLILSTYPVRMRLVKQLPVGVADADMTLADLTGSGIECNFSGYAYQTLTFGAAAIVAGPEGKAISNTVTFQPSGLAMAQTIYGYFLTLYYGGTEHLFLWKPLTTPVVMASDASQLQRTINLFDENFTP